MKNKPLAKKNPVTSAADPLGGETGNEPTLDVVILTYNSESTIHACLESLACQTSKNFEIIIVDDGSGDKTLEIVESFKTKFGLAIEVAQNGARNISRGRNIGMAASKGGLVAFLDSDDRASSNWAEAILKTFAHDPKIALLYSQRTLVSRALLGKAIAASDTAIFKLFNKKNVQFCTTGSVFNNRILNGNFLFDENFTYAEDLEIFQRISRRHKTYYDPSARIYQTSRETARSYAAQMYRYGSWKIYFGFAAKKFRLADFVPSLIILASAVAGIYYVSWLPLLFLPAFSFLESLFVFLTARLDALVLLFVFPAFLIKNFAWGFGVAVGLANLAVNGGLRSRLIQKRRRTDSENEATIAQVVGYYPPHLGGMENCANEISERLAAKGHRVIVFTSDIGGKNKQARFGADVRYLKSIEFAHTPIIFGLFFELARLPKNSVIHLHIAQAYVPEIVFLVSKIKRIPYVAHLHIDVAPSGKMGFLLPLYKKTLLRMVLASASEIIVPSRDYIDLISKQHSIPKNNIRELPNGVNRVKPRKQGRELHEPAKLLFVGRLTNQKNLPLLIESFKMMNDKGILAELRIVGEGEDRPMVEALIRSAGLQGKVFLLGSVYGKELLDIYSDSDILVMTSVSESFGLVLLEAMAAGLPVVASDIIGVRNVVENNETGILAELTPDSFSDAVGRLIADKRLRDRLIGNGLKKVEKYDWDKIVFELENVYRRIMYENKQQ